ncbi:MAG: Glycerol-3-phosphate acyltransferase [Candidatus Cloacimonetes bacterium ADurb.Bin088]|jgi:glycerol-3-phosphate acyltransferase PlsY|nr:MAG: Glycerol-3-phosphate acyltransferase [Candidatus Cloacimonetes bacterium ADurb.Bin088]
MTFPLLWIIVCAASYLLGSVPFGYLLGRLLHRKDIRSGGSGNIGATNALRQFGTATGILVLLFDLLKGFCVAWLCLRVIPATFPALFDVPIDPFVALLPALMVILGHMYSIFLGGKGGKGVATAAGVFIYAAPVPLFATLIFFVLIVALTRYVSLASVTGVLFLCLAQFFWNWYHSGAPSIPWFTMVVAALIIYKHQENILRLLEKRENKLDFSSKGKS